MVKFSQKISPSYYSINIVIRLLIVLSLANFDLANRHPVSYFLWLAYSTGPNLARRFERIFMNRAILQATVDALAVLNATPCKT